MAAVYPAGPDPMIKQFTFSAVLVSMFLLNDILKRNYINIVIEQGCETVGEE
jgi:hypothetical protein